MNALLIEGRREGYHPDQCQRTMTVAELIGYLEQFDGETPVYLSNDRGYTYGSITESSFGEEDFEEDEE